MRNNWQWGLLAQKDYCDLKGDDCLTAKNDVIDLGSQEVVGKGVWRTPRSETPNIMLIFLRFWVAETKTITRLHQSESKRFKAII